MKRASLFVIVLAACSASDADPRDGADVAADGTSNACESDDPCAGGSCVDVCGDPMIVRVGAGAWAGLAEVAHARRAPRFAARAGGFVVQVDGARLVVRAADTLREVGALHLGWYASGLAMVSDARAVVQSPHGALFIDIDGQGTATLEALWARTRVLGADAGRAIVETRAGFAVVDASAPSAPRVLECLDWPEAGAFYPFQSALDDGRFLLVGGADDARWGAWLYEVAAQPSPAPVRVPGDAPVAALQGERLLVFADEGVDRAVLYGLAEGAFTELGRVDAPRGSPWGDDVIVGGMLAIGGRYAAPRGLVDLEADAPEVYTVVAEQGCGWVVASGASDQRWGLEVFGDPSRRVAADALRAEGCTFSEAARFRADALAREPGGTRALAFGDGWWWLDLATFGASPVAVAPTSYGDPYWIGDVVYLVEPVGGGDWDLPEIGRISALDARDVSAPARSVARDFTIIDVAAGDRLWVLSEPTVRDFGEAGPVADRLVWSVGAAGDVVAVVDEPLIDARPIALAAAGAVVWIVDERGFVRRLGPGGAADSASFRGAAVPYASAASALGLFLTESDGALAWVGDDLQVHRLARDTECAPRFVVAADDAYVYVHEVRPGLHVSEPATELVVARPVAVGDRLELDVVARVPGAPRVFLGDPLLLLDGVDMRTARVGASPPE